MSTPMWLVEDHSDMAGVPFRDDGPPCITNGWCCGCAVHPLGKPWGWNSAAWDEHYATHHDHDAPGRRP